MNYKNQPLPVEVIQYADHRYNIDDLEQYTVDVPIDEHNRQGKFKQLPSDGPAALILNNCAFCAQLRSPAGLTEPEWFAAMTNLSRGVDGFQLIHDLAKPFLGDKYSATKTEKKIQHAYYDNNPHSCKYIQNVIGFKNCPKDGCGVKAPVGWATSKKKRPKPPAEPKPDDPEIFSPMEKLTDLGNAERFVRLFGDNLRYCHQFGSWLIWDGQRHKMDDQGQVLAFAKKAVRQFYIDAADIENPDIREAVLKHAKRSESAARLKSMIDLAEHMLPAHVDELDADKWLLNVINGVIDLRTGKLLPHDPSRLQTKLAPVTFDSKATCPRFQQFLTEVFPGGINIIPFLQRLAGYCLTGDTSEQKMAIAWGSGANGKSTLLNLLLDMLGDYAEMTPTETFMAKRNEGIPNDIARLRGARFVLASEAQEGRRLNEPLVKQVTGQDKLTARFLRQEFFSFQPQFKLVLLTNHKPLARGDDAALWRRILLVPFTQKFEGSKRDNSLPEKLRSEMSGILNWCIQGCLDWQKEGLNPPQEVLQATQEYQSENDIISTWIDECCVSGPYITSKTSDLYQNFMVWAQKNGEKLFTSQKKFSSSLQVRGFELFKGGGGLKRVRGLALLDTEHEEDTEPDAARAGGNHEEPF